MDSQEEYKIRDKVYKILESNIKEIPFEGTEVDKIQIIEDIIELIKELKN